MSTEHVFLFLRRLHLRLWQWIVLTFVGLALLLIAVLPGFLRREITARLTAATTADVRLANVDVNLFRGRLALLDLSFTLKGEKQPVITVQQLVGNLRMWSLLSGRVNLEEVQLSGLQIEAVQQADGQLNLTRLLPSPPPAEPPSPPSDLPTLTVERFVMSATKIDYQDHTYTPPTHFALTLEDLSAGDELQLQAQGLAAPVNVRLKGKLNDSPLQGEAQVLWSRTQTSVEATLDTPQLALAAIEPYLREALTLQRLSGAVGAQVHYRYHTGGDQPPMHALNGTFNLKQVTFADPLSGQTAMDLPSGQVVIETVDLLDHEIRLAKAELLAPKFFFLQTPTGLNWLTLVRPPDQAVQEEAPPSAPASAWRFSLQEARLTGGEIVYRDSVWPESETLSLVPEEIRVQQIGNLTAKSPLQFSLKFADGSLAGEGTLQLSPLALQTQVQIAGIVLTSVPPVVLHALAAESIGGRVDGAIKTELLSADGGLTAKVSGAIETAGVTMTGVPQPGQTLAWETARVELQEGSSVVPLSLDLKTQLSRLSLQHLPQGDVSIEKLEGTLRIVQAGGTASELPAQEAGVSDQAPTSIQAQGTLEVSSFLLAHGAEKQETLSCYLVRVQLKEGSRLLPLDLRLGDVALEYPYVQGFRTAVGQLQMFTPDSAPSSPPTSAPEASSEAASAAPSAQSSSPVAVPPPTVRIDRIILIGGQLYFEDRFIAPPQTIYWQDLRIDLSDVGYPLTRPTAFTLHAFNMDGAPIEVQGSTQRQGDILLSRVHGTIQKLSLPRFNAYLGSFLGYQVRNGAISVTWDLTIPGDEVKATTTVMLHDLGLSGKPNASVLEEQVGLPLQLVVALLKDLSGNINLQLPVEGRFGDPAFHLGGTILRAVRDVLIGAVTSPLKLLGAVFSGKDKTTLSDFSLEPIRFIPGTNQPNSAGKEQLAQLRSFLAQRPELNLQLSGYSGAEDVQVLKDRLILAQLQEQAQGTDTQSSAKTQEEGAPPPVTPPEEVRQFLARQLEQPRSGEIPALSVQGSALLAELRKQVTVAPQPLEQLAQDRVRAVIAVLTADSQVPADRLQLASEKLQGRAGSEVRYMVQAREGR